MSGAGPSDARPRRRRTRAGRHGREAAPPTSNSSAKSTARAPAGPSGFPLHRTPCAKRLSPVLDPDIVGVFYEKVP